MSHSSSYNLYSEMSVGSLISRAWRLYRLNFKKVILYSLIPSALIILASIIFNAPYAFPKNEEVVGALFCCLCPFGCLFYLVGIYISIFFNLGLIKAFSNIITNKPHDYPTIFNIMKQDIANALLMSFMFVGEFIFFTFINCAVAILCYFIVFIPLIPLALLEKSAPGEQFASIACGSMCFTVIIAMIFFFSILAIEFIFISIQFTTYAIERSSFIECIKRSAYIIFRRPAKTILFGVCVAGIYFVFNAYFIYPGMGILAMLSVNLKDFSEELAMLLMMVSINTWSHVVNLLLWPFLISAVVLFYYDTLIKIEGLDLKLLLNKGNKEPN